MWNITYGFISVYNWLGQISRFYIHLFRNHTQEAVGAPKMFIGVPFRPGTRKKYLKSLFRINLFFQFLFSAPREKEEEQKEKKFQWKITSISSLASIRYIVFPIISATISTIHQTRQHPIRFPFPSSFFQQSRHTEGLVGKLQ